MNGLVLRNVEVNGMLTDVSIGNGKVEAMTRGLERPLGSDKIEGDGGALLPGLHDHHLHLLATAAADRSVQLGPPAVRDRAEFADALSKSAAALSQGAWLRGVGYHESVAGALNKFALDSIVAEQPIRIQHASGAAWFLNSRALEMMGMTSPDGRIFRSDEQLRVLRSDSDPPSLAGVSQKLAACGVTGITDATPSDDLSSIALLGTAVSDGSLRQHVTVMGSTVLVAAPAVEGVHWGPVKVLLSDHDLLFPEEIAALYEVAHEHGRNVAVHCVTAVALALALAAWLETGVRDGDRIEHGSVIVPEAAARIAELGLVVVTQPGLVATRGDRYLSDVEAELLPYLYPCGSLLSRGIRVGGSTDAPYGDLDPWRAMSAAVERRTDGGEVLNFEERISPEQALGLFLTAPTDPGGRPREIQVGQEADLCLLSVPLARAMEHPSKDHVAATIVSGQVVYRR